MAKKKRKNPFFFLLVIVGITFTITACAYGVMTVRGIHPELAGNATEASDNFMQLIDQYGISLLAWQIGILSFLTIAAMLTDSYWSGRTSDNDDPAPSNSPP